MGLCGRSLHFDLRKRRTAPPSVPPALPVALSWRRLRTQTGSDSVDLASCRETRLSKFRATAFVQGLVSGLAAIRGSLLMFSLPFPEYGSGTAPPGSCTWRPWSGTTAVCAAWARWAQHSQAVPAWGRGELSGRQDRAPRGPGQGSQVWSPRTQEAGDSWREHGRRREAMDWF